MAKPDNNSGCQSSPCLKPAHADTNYCLPDACPRATAEAIEVSKVFTELVWRSTVIAFVENIRTEPAQSLHLNQHFCCPD